MYRWYRSDDWQLIADEAPRADDLPMLPDAWIEEFTAQAEYVKPSEKVSFTDQDAEGILTGGSPCQAVIKALDKYGHRRTADESARYDAMRDTQLAIVRLGRTRPPRRPHGHPGTPRAIPRRHQRREARHRRRI
jgi:hypothetical protein